MSIFGTEFTGWNKIIKRYIYISGISVFLIIAIFACKEDADYLGRDLLPSTDSILVNVDFSTKISSFSATGKRLNTSANTYYVLGNHKDSIFGFGSASVLTQLSPSQLSTPGAGFFLDSLVLSLTSAGFYGDSLSQQELRVFELEQPLDNDTSYSDLNPYEYGSFSSELASVTYNVGDTLIRVKITNPGFLNKFRTVPDSVFQDVADFINTFDGLFLRVDPVIEKGGFVYLDMQDLSTKLDLYYNGDTASKVYSMNLSYYSSKANVFSHDYSGFPIADKLNAPAGTDSLIYIEGLAGASGRISFPELSDWKDKGGLISINKAELILPVDTIYYPSLAKENFPSSLFLYELTNDGEYKSLYDYKVDQAGTYFGGSYDNIKKAYVFNIGLHLQSYISGKVDSPDLEIISRQSNSSANRVILKGASSLNSPVKLKVIYTKLF